MGFERIFPSHCRQACRAWVCLCAVVALSAVSLPAQVGATSVPLLLPSAIAFDADGNLYIGFLKNSNVLCIVNPNVFPFADPLKTQVVQSVGRHPTAAPSVP